MSTTNGEVKCRCGALARVSRVELAPGSTTPRLIELMHTHSEGYHEHRGADLDAVMDQLRLSAATSDDLDY